MRYILLTVFLTMNMNFGIVSDASAACCGAVGARLAQSSSRQSNEDDRTAGFIFAFMMAALCSWVTGQNEKKNK